MSWNTIPTFVDGVIPTADELNKILENMDYIHIDRPYVFAEGNGGGDYNTTSLSFTDLGSPFTMTFTANTGQYLVLFIAPTNMGTLSMYLDLVVDGASVSSGNGVFRIASDANMQSDAVAFGRVIELTAGSRTVKIQWKVSAGTGVIQNSSVVRIPVMIIVELARTP